MKANVFVGAFCVVALGGLMQAAAIGNSGPVFSTSAIPATVTDSTSAGDPPCNAETNCSGSGTSTPNPDGGITFTGSGQFLPITGPGTITFAYSGNGTGDLTAGIYAIWSFTVDEDETDPNVAYSLAFEINGETTTFSGSKFVPIDPTTGFGTPQTVTGQGALNYTVGQPLTSWSTTFSFTGVQGDNLTVDYSDPITIVVPSSSVPEPGCLLLGIPGLAVIALVRKTRNQG